MTQFERPENPGPPSWAQTEPPLQPRDVPIESRPATRGDISVVIYELRKIREVMEEVSTLLRRQSSNP